MVLLHTQRCGFWKNMEKFGLQSRKAELGNQRVLSAMLTVQTQMTMIQWEAMLAPGTETLPGLSWLRMELFSSLALRTFLRLNLKVMY